MYIAKLKAERFMMDDIEETTIFDTLQNAFMTYKNKYDWLDWEVDLLDTGLTYWYVDGIYEYQIINSTDGVEIHTDKSTCNNSINTLYPGVIMRVDFTISELEKGEYKKMRTIEELQKRIDKNIDEQNKELEEYKNIIFQLIVNNQLKVTPTDDDTFYKRLSFNFNMKNDAIIFECAIVENSERDKDVDATISQLYIKDGSKEVNKLIDYLCDVIIPSFKRDPYKSIQKKWDYM